MSRVYNILVIDDDDTVQSIITAFINRYMDEKGHACEIKRIVDPVQGLFVLNTHGEKFDAILLDVRLPKLTGDEIYNSLMAVNPELIGKIMFVTGYPNDLTERFPDLSLNILQKPFRFQNLSAKLDEFFSS